jgi:hypothetical protein
VIQALERGGWDPRPAGPDKWESQCPVHKGSRHNLSITATSDGKVLLKCHHVDRSTQTCPSKAIVAALGLTMGDLFAGTLKTSSGTRHAKGSFATPLDASKWLAKAEKGKCGGRWEYQDKNGVTVLVVCRLDDTPKGKQYRPIGLDPESGRWKIGDPPGLLPLYQLGDLADACRVYFFEGEKIAKLAKGLGLVATTTAHGAQSPHKSDLSPLAGKDVVIVPDHDDAGEGYKTQLVGLLGQLDPPPKVRTLRLDLPNEGDDFEQWIEARKGVTPGELRREFERLAEGLPFETVPPPAPPTVGVNGQVVAAEARFSEISNEDLGIFPLSSFKPRPIHWFWPYRLAMGSLALMAGDGGIGKSQFLLYIAHLASTGGEFPDRSGSAPLCDVIIVSAEDRPEDTIRPRLMAMGADISRIVIVKAKYTIRKAGKPPMVNPASFQDRAYWHEVFDRNPGCSLFIVDPLPSYLGKGVNDAKNTEVRGVLEPFVDEVIAPRGICMIGNTHLNKSVDAKTPMHRITGSIAYVNLSRNVHIIVRDPDPDPDDPERARRFFKQAKCNNAPDDLPALAFKLEKREIVGADGEAIETAIPVFEAEPVALDLGEALNSRGGKRGPAPRRQIQTAEWLYDFLAARTGWTRLRAIIDAAGEANLIGRLKDDGTYSGLTMLYRARERVEQLTDPRQGRRVDEMEFENRKHWRLSDAVDRSTPDPITLLVNL